MFSALKDFETITWIVFAALSIALLITCAFAIHHDMQIKQACDATCVDTFDRIVKGECECWDPDVSAWRWEDMD